MQSFKPSLKAYNSTSILVAIPIDLMWAQLGGGAGGEYALIEWAGVKKRNGVVT